MDYSWKFKGVAYIPQRCLIRSKYAATKRKCAAPEKGEKFCWTRNDPLWDKEFRNLSPELEPVNQPIYENTANRLLLFHRIRTDLFRSSAHRVCTTFPTRAAARDNTSRPGDRKPGINLAGDDQPRCAPESSCASAATRRDRIATAGHAKSRRLGSSDAGITRRGNATGSGRGKSNCYAGPNAQTGIVQFQFPDR